MHKSGRPVSFWSAVAMGIGAMVGAGIFALLGQAGAIASSAVYLSFLAGGGIALLAWMVAMFALTRATVSSSAARSWMVW